MCDQGVNLSVNGKSSVPPGFRFHPTEEELLHYYLRKKVACEKIDLDVILEVDLNKLEPWDIQEMCRIGSTPQNDWYLFSHKDRKYPTGIRTNRATAAGFWKATGRDKIITSNSKRIGMRKTLVFYRGRAPQGKKSDWIMHEYRLDDSTAHQSSNPAPSGNLFAAGSESEDVGWVVCRVFRKKGYHKPTVETSTGSKISPVLSGPHTENGGIINQIFDQYIDKPSLEQGNIQVLEKEQGNGDKLELENSSIFIQLPRLKTPTGNHDSTDTSEEYCKLQSPILKDWAALDRFVASQLNGEPMNEDFDTFSFNHDNDMQLLKIQNSDKQNLEFSPVSSSDTNLWSFSR